MSAGDFAAKENVDWFPRSELPDIVSEWSILLPKDVALDVRWQLNSRVVRTMQCRVCSVKYLGEGLMQGCGPVELGARSKSIHYISLLDTTYIVLEATNVFN